MRANVLESEDISEQLIRRRSAFHANTEKLHNLAIKERLYYHGVLLTRDSENKVRSARIRSRQKISSSGQVANDFRSILGCFSL